MGKIRDAIGFFHHEKLRHPVQDGLRIIQRNLHKGQAEPANLMDLL
jgi:hypothetical protein